MRKNTYINLDRRTFIEYVYKGEDINEKEVVRGNSRGNSKKHKKQTTKIL